MDDDTIELPSPDDVVTQEIPVPGRAGNTQSFRVETVPMHLLGDPILSMEEPEPPTANSVFELIQEQTEEMVPPVARPVRLPRRRMQSADKFLLALGTSAAVGATFVCGMVAYGWGAGDTLDRETSPKVHTTVVVSPPEPTYSVAPMPRRVSSPRRERVATTVSAPHVYRPRPTHSVVVISSPTPTPASESPSAPQTASQTPEPTETPTTPSSSASGSPEPSPSSPGAHPSISLGSP